MNEGKKLLDLPLEIALSSKLDNELINDMEL